MPAILRFLGVFLPVLSGCSINQYQPSHFQFTTIVGEIAETRIPLIVDLLDPPATTLFHALFATDPENVAV
ncbi:hypothetical protein [Vitiosangium sp. GDMCC 1.1324]|uniref:hypothetical protein n=1 Tax=Vitiosangium sp. (strain GDMCC 1.1324) TaxID=2138576 RepID=UPI000D33A2A3|nr:hypothetical protein [Vitiosangium sp. GDMCC 1.1324]PTL78817.1 hypothetical protein DAT35_37805 [Vitiosangium sp. GDMCC 1.1324]